MSDTKVKVTYYEPPNYATIKEDSDVRRIDLIYKSDQVMVFHMETSTKYPQAVAYHGRGFFYYSESSYVKIDVDDSFLDCTLQGTANCDASENALDQITVIFQPTRYGGHLIFLKDDFTAKYSIKIQLEIQS